MGSESLSSTNEPEHLRLLKALRESEILRELAELLASSLDPTQILEVLVKRVTEVCDVERCSVWLLDEASALFIPSAYHLNVPHLTKRQSLAIDRVWRRSSLPFKDSVIRRLLEANGMLALADLSTEAGWQAIAEKFLVRSILLVALLREGRLVGMMSLDNPGQQRIFSQEQQQLARAIGQQAAVAIDNARLYQQVQMEKQRAERLIGRAQSIYQVAMAVNSDNELPAILEIAAHSLARGLDADGATIALLEGDALSVVRTTQLQARSPATSDTYLTLPISDLPHCLAAAERKVPLFVRAEDIEGKERHWLHRISPGNTMIIPLTAGPHSRSRFSTGNLPGIAPHCAGFAFVTYQQNQPAPTAGQFAFAQDIAAQCALAIDKANLLAQTSRVATLATERANLLDAVFNAMTEGIVVLDLDGRVLISNNTATHFIGMKSTGQPLLAYLQDNPVYTPYGQPFSPEDFPLTRALHGEHIRGERFVTRRADGSERIVEVNTAPLFDSSAGKIGVVGAFRDITEQIRVERRIRHALDTMLHAAEAISGVTDTREMLRRVLAMTLNVTNSERGAVQLYNMEQQVFLPLLSIGFNQAEETRWLLEQRRWLEPEEGQYTGLREQLLAGHACLVSADQCPEQADNFHQTMILAAPITHNSRLLGVMMLDRSATLRKEQWQSAKSVAPGATRPLPRPEFSIWDVAVAEGIAQFAGLAIEQARWQQEAEIARTNEAAMRESNALKDEFLAITAHEFRNPLTVIQGNSQMIERVVRKHNSLCAEIQEKLFESTSQIETQTRHLTNIVNTFLEVTRLNRGQITLTLEEHDLAEIVQEAVRSHSTTSPAHQLSCSIQPAPHPYRTLGDRARLLQIFANLLQNAIKYSPLGGPVTVSLTQYTDEMGRRWAQAEVADKGVGIPPEAQSRLFERFYRAPNITGGTSGGVGLGLYVVAQFLHLHGGSIRVESSGIMGEGSRFILTLPLLA
ncbi:MAG: GAF domain-containing protein [Ktedonobacteraceae bacterium]|nr:GAF domain-containing protein [Ktedonobacteraceae bacterium]